MMYLSNVYIKLIFVLLIIPLSKCSLSEKKVAFHLIIEKDGIIFLKGSDDPFSGVIFEKYGNGKMKKECVIKMEFQMAKLLNGLIMDRKRVNIM